MVPTRAPVEGAEIGGASGDAVAAARRWMGEHATDRFFLWVHLYEVHVPYISPPEVHARLGSKPVEVGTADWGTKTREEIQTAYRAEVLEVDDAVGSMVALLEELGLGESTVVALVSDHGEYLGEHGGLYGHSLLKEEVMRIPMVIHGVGIEPRVHGGAVSAVDLAPTLLEIMALPALPGATGRSLVGDGAATEVPIYGEWRDIRLHDATQQAESRDHLVGVWNGRKKMVRSQLSAELRAYDLSDESREEQDIYSMKAEWMAGLTADLDRFPVAQTPVSSKPVTMSVDGLQLLRALGYVE